MTRLDSPVVLKHKQLLWRQHQGFQMSSFSRAGFLGTGSSSTRQTLKKKRSVLVCGISVKHKIKISTLSDGEVCTAFLEENNGSPNKTVAKIKN